MNITDQFDGNGDGSGVFININTLDRNFGRIVVCDFSSLVVVNELNTERVIDWYFTSIFGMSCVGQRYLEVFIWLDNRVFRKLDHDVHRVHASGEHQRSRWECTTIKVICIGRSGTEASYGPINSRRAGV